MNRQIQEVHCQCVYWFDHKHACPMLNLKGECTCDKFAPTTSDVIYTPKIVEIVS
jgi:hypothetical protein